MITCQRCGEVNPAEIHTCTPKREWVGLTDDEIEMLCEQADHSPWKAIELTQARLKEKNL